MARGAQLAQAVLQRRDRLGVEAGEGLVEEEEVRPVQQRACEREPLRQPISSAMRAAASGTSNRRA